MTFEEIRALKAKAAIILVTHPAYHKTIIVCQGPNENVR